MIKSPLQTLGTNRLLSSFKTRLRKDSWSRIRQWAFLSIALPALTLLSYVDVLASSDYVSLDVVVTTSGHHPSGGSFDGLRFYLLPVETTSVTPPDLRLMLIDREGPRWVGNSDPLSPCPDAETCRFREVVVDPFEPFAFVLFDGDPWIGDIPTSLHDVDALIGRLRSQFENADRATIVGGDFAEKLTGHLADGAKALERIFSNSRLDIEHSETSDDLFAIGANDYVDTLLVVPGYDTPIKDLKQLTAQVRIAVEKHANTLLGSAERRVSGQLNIAVYDECALIACDLAYSNILFEEQ